MTDIWLDLRKNYLDLVLAVCGSLTLGNDDEILIPGLPEIEIIEKALSNLRPREKRVLQMHFGLNSVGQRYTLREIGDEMNGVSRSWIGQIKKRALAKLQRPPSLIIGNRHLFSRRRLTVLVDKLKAEVLMLKAGMAELENSVRDAKLGLLSTGEGGLPVDYAAELREKLAQSVDVLEISVRGYNCLKIAGIKTIGELVQKSAADILAVKGSGRMTLAEIKGLLAEIDLYLGMKINP